MTVAFKVRSCLKVHLPKVPIPHRGIDATLPLFHRVSTSSFDGHDVWVYIQDMHRTIAAAAYIDHDTIRTWFGLVLFVLIALTGPVALM